MRSLLLTAMLMPLVALAVDIDASGVTVADGVYSMHITAAIDAPVPLVYDAITDYANLTALNPDIEESRLVDSGKPGTQRVHSVLRVCILVFCRRVVQVQDVVHREHHVVEAVMVPGAGDFRTGSARWSLAGNGPGRTTLHFTQRIEPDFWVPPLIGPWLIRRKLVDEVRITARHLEQQARLPSSP